MSAVLSMVGIVLGVVAVDAQLGKCPNTAQHRPRGGWRYDGHPLHVTSTKPTSTFIAWAAIGEIDNDWRLAWLSARP